MGLKVAPWDLKCWRQLRNHLPLCRTLRGDRQGLGEATIEGGGVLHRAVAGPGVAIPIRSRPSYKKTI